MCQRHFFAQETACPFCGAATESREALRAPANSGISRAQIYAAGMALATGVAAGCGGSNTHIEAPPPNPTVNTSGKVLLVAAPTPGENLELAGEDEEAARERQEEDRRRQEMKRQQEWERERSSGRSCSTDWLGRTICPPYGCVFPDDACDVLRV